MCDPSAEHQEATSGETETIKVGERVIEKASGGRTPLILLIYVTERVRPEALPAFLTELTPLLRCICRKFFAFFSFLSLKRGVERLKYLSRRSSRAAAQEEVRAAGNNEAK